MTDYIKQVAEAVRNSIFARWVQANDAHEQRESITDVDTDIIIDRVPKPDPVFLSEAARDYLQDGINDATQCEDPDIDFDFANELSTLLGAIYAYPPDAQAEIERLNELTDRQSAHISDVAHENYQLKSKATEREGFIDQLLEDLRLVREQLAKHGVIRHD